MRRGEGREGGGGTVIKHVRALKGLKQNKVCFETFSTLYVVIYRQDTLALITIIYNHKLDF